MNWLDYVIIGTVVLSTLVGVIRGVTRELFGLATWASAFLFAYLFADRVNAWFTGWISDPALRMLAAYALVFLVVLAIGAVVTSLLASWIRDTRLSGADRTLGGGFGLVRAIVLVGAGVLLSDLAQARDAEWWQRSELAPRFEPVGRAIAALLPRDWLEALEAKPAEAPSAP